MKFRLAGPNSSPVVGDAARSIEQLLRSQFAHASREDLVNALAGSLVRSLVQLDDSQGAAVAISDLLAGIAEDHAVPGTVVIVGPLNPKACPDCGAYPPCPPRHEGD